MEYRSLTTGEPVYFAYEDHTKKRKAAVKLAHCADRYHERFGVRPKRALVNAADAAELNGSAEFEISGRHHIPSGVFFLELPS